MKIHSSSTRLFVRCLMLGFLMLDVLSTAASQDEQTAAGPYISLAFVTPQYSRSRATKLRRISRTRINHKFVGTTDQQQQQETTVPLASDHESRPYRRNNTKIIRRNRTTISTRPPVTSTTTPLAPYHVNRAEELNMKNSLIISSVPPSTTRLDEPLDETLDTHKDHDSPQFHYAYNRTGHQNHHRHHNPQHQHAHWNFTNQGQQSHVKMSNDNTPNVHLESDYLNYLNNGTGGGGTGGPAIESGAGGGAGDKVENSKRYWAFILFVFPFFTIFGNLLVVLSVVKEKNLHTVTNYFIVSLAISDMTVAAGVMPLAVYYEFSQKWIFSPKLCDAWVALDVMASTASILNLVSIAVDRFIAVTQPLKYARHKNSKRIYFMIGFVWLISVSVASPIVIGFNNSPARRADECSFFNNQFLIYSSMFSFYIPTIAMIFLYYKIFQVIRSRAKKSTAKKFTPKDGANAKKGKAAEKRMSTTSALANNTAIDATAAAPSNASRPGTGTESAGKPSLISVGIFNLKNRTSGLDVETDAHLLTSFNDKNDEFANQPQTAATDAEADATKKPLLVSGKQPGKPDDKPASPQRTAKNKPSPLGVLRSQSSAISAASSNKERKVTKMLAIVLICFLVCWSPFFTINNLIKPICEVMERNCDFIKADYISFMSWLGYLNSLLNPIIYTIFNVEFRIAFKKILKEICCKK